MPCHTLRVIFFDIYLKFKNVISNIFIENYCSSEVQKLNCDNAKLLLSPGSKNAPEHRVVLFYSLFEVFNTCKMTFEDFQLDSVFEVNFLEDI